VRGHRLTLRRCFGAALLLLPPLGQVAAQSIHNADLRRGRGPTYDAEEVSIETAAGNVLAGTLTRPFQASRTDDGTADGDRVAPSVGSTGIPTDSDDAWSAVPSDPPTGVPSDQTTGSAGGQPADASSDPTTASPGDRPEGATGNPPSGVYSDPPTEATGDAPALVAETHFRIPAIVLISGSGPDNRDAAPRWMPGYQPFWQIADALTRRGIAVLRLDDRGVGLSTGGFENATVADFADDVRAALAYLRNRPDIDGARLGILGHSEGGVVATMVAAEDPALKAMVLLASPGTNLRSVVAYQLRYWLERDPAISFADRERLLVQQLARWDVFADANPRLKFSRTYNPIEAVKRISTPVLILHGEADRQVPPKHAEKLAKALRKGGNADVTLRILQHVDHLFLQDRSGNPAAYSQLTSRRIPGSVLDELGDWAEQRLAGGGASVAGAEPVPDPRGPDASNTGG
jgi:uncharacterized protein